MSSLTLRPGMPAVAARSPPGGFADLMRRLIEARERQARRRVVAELSLHADERLRGMGLSETDIRAIRSGTFRGLRV